jgi:hypothetical protein
MLTAVTDVHVGNGLTGQLGIVVGELVERISAALVATPALRPGLSAAATATTAEQTIPPADAVGHEHTEGNASDRAERHQQHRRRPRGTLPDSGLCHHATSVTRRQQLRSTKRIATDLGVTPCARIT